MFGYIYKKDAAIIAVVLCLCLGVGSFFDYQISSALFNIGSMYGRFIEAAGELPFELTASPGWRYTEVYCPALLF